MNTDKQQNDPDMVYVKIIMRPTTIMNFLSLDEPWKNILWFSESISIFQMTLLSSS